MRLGTAVVSVAVGIGAAGLVVMARPTTPAPHGYYERQRALRDALARRDLLRDDAALRHERRRAGAPQILRFLADGSLDRSFTPTGEWGIGPFALTPAGDVVVAGRVPFTVGNPQALALLTPGGRPPFWAGRAGTGPIGGITDIRPLPDGGLVLLGQVYGFGNTYFAQRNLYHRVIRLKPDRTYHATLVPTREVVSFHHLTVTPSGKIVFAWPGRGADRLVRLAADGSTDDGFAFRVPVSSPRVTGVWPLDRDRLLVRVRAAGTGGALRTAFFRLNETGAWDATYRWTGDPTVIEAVLNAAGAAACAADGSLFVAATRARRPAMTAATSEMVTLSGPAQAPDALRSGPGLGRPFRCGNERPPTPVPVPRVARFDPSGQLDAAFLANTDAVLSESTGPLKAIAFQGGELLIAGAFTTGGSGAQTPLLRLQPDGRRDASFNAPGAATAGAAIASLFVLPDGRILATTEAHPRRKSEKTARSDDRFGGTADLRRR